MENTNKNVSGSHSKSKRIALNTSLLFVRMSFLTAINLYTVRLVLRGLGNEDYGIFNSVAGVVLIGSFISSILSLSIQRFYSISMGENKNENLKDIFSASINIIFAISVFLLLFFEVFGVWFVNSQLVIPENRIEVTHLIFQFGLFSFIFSLLQIPFMAAFFAHEDMGIYSLISTIECVLRLLVAYYIGKTNCDNLAFYGGGLLAVSIIIFLLYAIVGHIKYDECSYHKTKGLDLYKQLLSFSGWTLFGSVAAMGIIQGNIILTNIYYGPIITAAFAIAIQIYNAFNTLCGSMVLAFRPAMIKAYAEENYLYLNRLFSVSNKFILYTLAALSIPIIVEIEPILELWLGEVSSEMLLFSRLIILYVYILALNSPITIIMQASGHIREYHLPVESITLMCLPLTWLLFKFGFPSYSLFLSMITVCLCAHVVRLICLRRFYSLFSISDYVNKLIIPAVLIISLGVFVAYFLHATIEDMVLRFISVCMFVPFIILILSFFIGLNGEEKEYIKRMIKSYRK